MVLMKLAPVEHSPPRGLAWQTPQKLTSKKSLADCPIGAGIPVGSTRDAVEASCQEEKRGALTCGKIRVVMYGVTSLAPPNWSKGRKESSRTLQPFNDF